MSSKAQIVYESQVKSLSAHERLQLIELITHDLRETMDSSEGRSILELHGLGAEIWKGIDAQEYVAELRDEWDQRP